MRNEEAMVHISSSTDKNETSFSRYAKGIDKLKEALGEGVNVTAAKVDIFLLFLFVPHHCQ